MNTVVSNNYYSIQFDKTKNRFYFSIKGAWLKRDLVPNYLDDWTNAVKLTTPGFTILSDVTDMGPNMVHDLHIQAQKILVNAGLGRTAEVYKEGSIVAKAQVEQAAQDSGMPMRQFFNKQEAETWLDSK